MTVTIFLAVWLLALAQPFPSRPVKIVVPTTPGGSTDALSRSIGAQLSELWAQPVVVENKPGATQIIGGEYVAKSPPDGYTLIVSDAATFIMNPILHRNLSYEGLRAFTPITLLVRFPWVVVVHPSIPAANFPRHRLLGPHQRRLHEEAARRRSRARAIQGSGARGYGSPGRPDPDDDGDPAAGRAACARGQAAPHRRGDAESHCATARLANHRRIRRARLRGGDMVRLGGARGHAARHHLRHLW
ncbi:MAG: hypothetical protein JF611_13920 [Betaproteobacteria bacterium]|nr:hypothetical protein [Betaproteobacteria bacterium]